MIPSSDWPELLGNDFYEEVREKKERMSVRVKPGIHTHTASGRQYRVRPVVIYSQQYQSKFRGTNVALPKGSVWVRDLQIDYTNILKCWIVITNIQ